MKFYPDCLRPKPKTEEQIESEKKKNFKPPTYEQIQQILNLIIDVVEQQASLKAQIAILVSMAKNQDHINEETKAAIELLFGRVIELEQGITGAGIEIPRANKVVN